MNQSGIEQNKWTQSGWKIEQRYGNKVLLGNWAEERLQFTREPRMANSTSSRVDYKPHWDFKPDVSERRSALLRAEGIPPKMLFGHHHSPSSHSTTEYGWSFPPRHDCFLPTLKFLESDKLEQKRSDTENPRPLSLTSPSLEKMQSHHSPMTLYQSTYQRHPPDAFCKNRCARASRMLSSHLYSVNNNHKDLNLRQNTLLQVPDSQVHTGTTQAQKLDRGF